jgi:hypothetical protein
VSFIQNLYTSRDNNANAETYVGQTGRLWWDPVTNSLYYSDGSTPGGIPVGSGGNGSPGGSNTQIQFNNNGSFGGSSNFTFNGTTVTITGNVAPGNILTNNYLYANGVSIFANTPFGGNTTFANISVSGTANLGNFTITDQTMSGTIDGRDITYATLNGNANFNVLGGFNVHSANLEAEPDFSVSTNGVVRVLVPDASNLAASFQIVGSADGSIVDPQNYGVMLHTTGQPNLPARIYNDGAASYAAYIGRRYNGTSAAPTGVTAGQIISRVGATPYLSNGTWPNLSTTRIDYVATENQTTSAQGSRIELYTTPDGANTSQMVARFEQEGIILTGNVIPATNNDYNLGNNTNKWASLHLGPDSLFIEDTTLGTDAELTVDNGVLLINGAQKIQIGNMQMTTAGISLVNPTSNNNLIVGQTTNTGYLEIDMLGIEFKDGTRQITAAIPLAQKGVANGVVPLDASTKIDPIYLPAGAITFKGVWDAANNSPTLADGIGNVGDEYIVGVAGNINLGSGNISFAVGDFALYTASNVWVDIPVGGAGVDSFNGRTGIVTLLSSDVTNALSNGSITNNFLNTDSWSLTVGQGIGLTGNSTVELGDSITLTNTGVTAAIGGIGVAVSAATGNVTFSIGQPVGTANSVTFLSVTSNTTIQATGNITGGNIATAGQVVATGNIRGGNIITASGTLLNNGLFTTGNIAGGNLAITGVATVTGNITGGNITTAGRVTATGNVIGGNIVGQNLTPTRVTFVGSGKEIDDDAEFTYNDTTNTLSVGNISASGNVTAAYYYGNGSTLTGTTGGSTYYGQFWSTVTQVNAGATTANPMTFDTSDTFNTGVSIAVGNISHVVIANPGTYNIQFSAQLAKTDSGQDTISIWLAKDGVNVADSCTDVDLNGNNARAVAAWNWLVNTTTANTYYQILWSSADTAMELLAQGARINPTRPAIPSVILTVTQA